MALDHHRRNEWIVGTSLVVAGLLGFLEVTRPTGQPTPAWRTTVAWLCVALIVAVVLFVLHGTGPIQILLSDMKLSRSTRRRRRSFGRWTTSYSTKVNGEHTFYVLAPTDINNISERDYRKADVGCRWTDSRRIYECSLVMSHASWLFTAEFPRDFQGIDALQLGKQRIEWLVDETVVASEPIVVRKDGSVHRRWRRRIKQRLSRFRHHYWPDEVK